MCVAVVTPLLSLRLRLIALCELAYASSAARAPALEEMDLLLCEREFHLVC